MKVLWSWLLELCDLDRQPTVEEGAKALTRGGLEIEGLTELGAGFSGVVVAQVVGKRPHPQADKLTLVDVIIEKGGPSTQVVCGAPNVPEPGRKVLWAQVGAKLPGGITLQPKPVKGIVSPGMLCAEDELGLSEDHAGIVVLPEDDHTALGSPAQVALGLNDWMLEVNAPANRGDVLGHLGIARELCAVLRGKLVWPDAELAQFTPGAAGQGEPALEIRISDPALSSRYTGRYLEGLEVGPSPARIAQRLRGVGVRSISNLVDVTNYVLFELGTPLHAFDAATLKTGTIAVTSAKDGEQLTTLDKLRRTLIPGDIVIRDGDQIVALAGVMGGLATEVTASTTRVLLEVASFQPVAIRRTAKRLNLPSEASLRFGRGVDPSLAEFASARAARLMCQLAGGTVSGPMFDAYPGKRVPAAIGVRLPRVQMLTGVASLDAATCTDALTRLEFDVTGEGDHLVVTPPSARGDVTREVDVIEEVLRITGYEQVASTLPALRKVPAEAELHVADLARRALANAGGYEAITYGFQSAERNGALGLAPSDKRSQPIAVRNPMSAEQAVMRTSLLPNLIAAIARNQSYGRPDVCLFEVGSVFWRRGEGVGEQQPHELADEPVWASGVLAGKRRTQLGAGSVWDAFDAKAFALEAIRAVAGNIEVRTKATSTIRYLHPGVAGELVIEGTSDPAGRRVVGWFGELHPSVRAKLGVAGPAFAYEVDLEALAPARPAQMKPIPRFPGAERDVSLLLAEDIPAGRVRDVIAAVGEELVTGVRVLEDYRDAKLGAGMKSMLWSIAYRSPERTLTDAEVEKAHEAIVARLVENLPAQRR